VYGSIARGEHQHVQVFVYQAKGLVAAFWVVLACVLGNERCAPVEVLSQVKGNASFDNVAFVFGRIVGQAH